MLTTTVGRAGSAGNGGGTGLDDILAAASGGCNTDLIILGLLLTMLISKKECGKASGLLSELWLGIISPRVLGRSTMGRLRGIIT